METRQCIRVDAQDRHPVPLDNIICPNVCSFRTGHLLYTTEACAVMNRVHMILSSKWRVVSVLSFYAFLIGEVFCYTRPLFKIFSMICLSWLYAM
jgi:hypothetical protein